MCVEVEVVVVVGGCGFFIGWVGWCHIGAGGRSLFWHPVDGGWAGMDLHECM